MAVSNNIFTKIILFYILFLSYNCQVKIPLTFFPIYSINLTTPSNIIQYYIEQKVYANLEIGNPKQIVQIPLEYDSNDFYIIDCEIFKKDTKRFSGFKIYNSSNSNDHHVTDEDFKNGYYFELATYDIDTFYFNNEKHQMDFYNPYDYDGYDSGGIGMQLNPRSDIDDATPDKERTFFEKLKRRGITQDYFWTIFYNSKGNQKQDEGFLLIGSLPHEVNKDDLGYYKKNTFKEENLRYINLPYSNPHVDSVLEIDLIYGYQGNNRDKVIEGFPFGNTEYKKLYLDYNSGGVKIPKYLQPFYHSIFEDYIKKKECFNDTFNGKNNVFYYCKKDQKILNQIKKVFPGINFRSQELNKNFTIEADDLFIEENNLIFCLAYFSSSYDTKFILGKPFLKKYLFTFNYYEKYISFYEGQEEKGKGNGNKGISLSIFILVIIGTIIVVAIISFIIFKFYLYDKYFRKKRANELDDGDYYYSPKEEKQPEKDPLNIN